MSSIQDKIKQLQRQQAKIELLQLIKTNAATLQDPEGHEGLGSEVGTVISTFVDNVVSRIEGGENFGGTDKSGEVRLTSEELSVLKKLVPALAQIKNGTVVGQLPNIAQYQEESPASPTRRLGSDPISKEDRRAFAVQWQSVGGKKIKAVTEEGIPVEGPVIQLDAPFVVVRNDLAEGELTRVRPENIQ